MVVEPWGAHPSYAQGYYDRDNEFYVAWEAISRDPVALAGAICTVLEHPEEAAKFRLAGRRRVAEQFSLERMVRETERLYLDVVETVR